MSTVYFVVTVATVAANGWAAYADFTRAGFVLANAAELELPLSWLPMLGVLKAAGAAGLIVGLAGVRLIGVHIRAQAYSKIAFPAAFLALAAVSLGLAVM